MRDMNKIPIKKKGFRHMQIHTVKPGDTIFKIARQYSTSPMKIIENNELENPDRLSVGQKLLILTPTRTYTTRGSDTLERIADRFGVTKESLYRSNPYLYGSDKLYPGQVLAIKYDTPPYGMACANGYYYNGTSADRLSLVLPYLTYITLGVGRRDKDGIELLFDDTDVVAMAKERGRIPLMRVYDGESGFSDAYADTLILLAKTHGYGGITLASYRAMRENKAEYEEFLMKLKKRLMEHDLRLFCELDGNRDTRLADVCDGYVIMYEKSSLDNIPTFEDGERRVMTEFAEHSEPSKAYIELPSLGYMGDEELLLTEAERLAHAAGQEILFDGEKKISHFHYNKYRGGKRERVRVAYESLENAKAKLDLAGELGFMGVAFDIMRVPVSYLMMFDTSFRRPTLYSDM